MDNKFNKLKKQVKGITLVTLVVTIIVLLILAGVAINLSLGDNGIYRRAKEAVDIYQNASENETIEIDKVLNYIDAIYDNMNETKVIDGVTIPYGFYYVGGTKKEGIVVSDNIEDKDKYKGEINVPGDNLIGNQFVWIPVDNFDDFQRYNGYYNGMPQEQMIETYCSEPYTNAAEWEIKEYNEMLNSIRKNKGFFVGRYEAGIDNNNIVIKKDAKVWSNIPWGASMTEPGEETAVSVSRRMYTQKNKFNVTSTLIYGTQWDAIMQFIDYKYKNQNCDADTSFVANSSGKANDTKTLLPCGSSEKYKIKNIYDLCGNVYEWTMEAYVNGDEILRIDRAGNFNTNPLEVPASNRGYSKPTAFDIGIGFRVALYL